MEEERLVYVLIDEERNIVGIFSSKEKLDGLRNETDNSGIHTVVEIHTLDFVESV